MTYPSMHRNDKYSFVFPEINSAWQGLNFNFLSCYHYLSTEKLAQIKVEVPEVTQSEVGQKQKLKVVLDVVNKILQVPASWTARQKWSVDSEWEGAGSIWFHGFAW